MACCQQVGQSLQRFGISEDTDQILVASFHMDDPDVRHIYTEKLTCVHNVAAKQGELCQTLLPEACRVF